MYSGQDGSDFALSHTSTETVASITEEKCAILKHMHIARYRLSLCEYGGEAYMRPWPDKTGRERRTEEFILYKRDSFSEWLCQSCGCVALLLCLMRVLPFL